MSKTVCGASAPASSTEDGCVNNDQPSAAKRYLRPKQAAEYVHSSPSTLAKKRMDGTGPIYSKAGPRLVIYDIAELDRWLESNKRLSTSQAA